MVEKIIKHADTSTEQIYDVRWYGYTSAQATLEPEENLPRHFIDRDWKVMTKVEKRSNRSAYLSFKHFTFE